MLLIILLAELILLILFFVYMDKVNLQRRSHVGHTALGIEQEEEGRTLASGTCRVLFRRPGAGRS